MTEQSTQKRTQQNNGYLPIPSSLPFRSSNGGSTQQTPFHSVKKCEGVCSPVPVCSGGVLKEIFNNSFDEPVCACEMGMPGIMSFLYHYGEVGGLPPLGPPPLPPTSCYVPSPPMTPSERGRRKNGSTSSHCSSPGYIPGRGGLLVLRCQRALQHFLRRWSALQLPWRRPYMTPHPRKRRRRGAPVAPPTPVVVWSRRIQLCMFPSNVFFFILCFK